MLHEVVMPKLAMGMSEGTVIDWKVAQGGRIEKGQVLLEIETEKVTSEIEALETGVVNILTPPGETVPTYHVIAQIADSAEEFAGDGSGAAAVAPATDDRPAAANAAAQPAKSSGGRIIASPAAKKLAKEHGVDLAQVSGTGTGGKIDKKDVQAFVESGAAAEPAAASVKASPVAKKLAKEHGVDLAQVAGSGPGGKVGKEDVLAAIEKQAALVATSAPETASDSTEPGVRATIPMRGMRAAVATNMMKSLSTTAQITTTIEYDATELVKFRTALLEQEEQLGLRVSYLDLMIMIAVRAVDKVPLVNSSIVDDEIKVWEQVNVGIAVATEISDVEYGLFVPVVRDAGNKKLSAICREVRDLSGKVSSGEITPDMFKGGTMTISSAAMVTGFVQSTPVLSPGQAVLIQPSLIEERPFAKNGEVVACPVLRVSYTYDHRIIDGVPFAKYSEVIKGLIECPAALVL
jgi:pyruvate/2-oxoglutarate dehydrogenase complex dihydrolipoamide acyltransferase (E2) component